MKPYEHPKWDELQKAMVANRDALTAVKEAMKINDAAQKHYHDLFEEVFADCEKEG